MGDLVIDRDRLSGASRELFPPERPLGRQNSRPLQIVPGQAHSADSAPSRPRTRTPPDAHAHYDTPVAIAPPPLPARRRDTRNGNPPITERQTVNAAGRQPITGVPSSTPPPEVFNGGYLAPVPGYQAVGDGYLPPDPAPGYVSTTTDSRATVVAVTGGDTGGAAGGADEPSFDGSGLHPKMLEALGLGSPADTVFGWEAPPDDAAGQAPPDYTPRSVLNRGTGKSLKLTQVEQLKKEISHRGGVKIVLRKIDCYHTVAFVDAFGKTWVAGWMQKARPFLHNAFHVGDQVVSINGQVIEGAHMAHKLIKHCEAEDKIAFIIRRIPHGRVIAVTREAEGQNLGLTREGGTAEVLTVDTEGLAARHGLPVRAQTVDGQNLCNWWITEVNSRPVNMFFKDNEIEHRLNAVGKDITLLLQPIEFIAGLKKALKNSFKNYKDFLVQ